MFPSIFLVKAGNVTVNHMFMTNNYLLKAKEPFQGAFLWSNWGGPFYPTPWGKTGHLRTKKKGGKCPPKYFCDDVKLIEAMAETYNVMFQTNKFLGCMWFKK